jgi:MoxR-like ATPase
MQEREVTAGQSTYSLPNPFFTIATQNPIEQEGTYPLPEAQLDRFMFNIKVDYPSAAEEEQILAATTRHERPEVTKVLSERAILNLQKLVGSVAVSEHIIKYVASLVRATRPKDASAPKFVQELVDWGAGPRAGQFLIHGGKALAAMDGRFSVAIDDVQKVARAPASDQHEFSSASGRTHDGGSHRATAARNSAARDSEVCELSRRYCHRGHREHRGSQNKR